MRRARQDARLNKLCGLGDLIRAYCPACDDRGRQGRREALTPGAAERSGAALI